MKLRAMAVLVAGLLLGLTTAASAQSADFYGPQTVDPPNQGGPWFTPAQRGLSYTHDLSTGAVSLRLAPWGVIRSARGPAIPFALVFFYGMGVSIYGSFPYSGQWDADGPPAGNANPDDSPWAETAPTLFRSWASFVDQFGDECDQSGPYTFTDFGGLGHDLGLGQIEYSDPGAMCNAVTSTASQALDEPALYSAFAPGSDLPAYVTDGSGTRYYFDWSSGNGELTKFEDANGNYVTVTGVTGAGPEVWTDAAGKVVLEIYRQQYGGASGPYLPSAIDTFDASAHAREYLATWTSERSSGINLAYPDNQTCSCSMNTVAGISGYELTSLQLPDGSNYTISYDAETGAVGQINYPTGGWVRFAYGDAQNTATCVFGNPGGSGYQYLPCDQMAATDEWRNDGTSTYHWSYAYSGAASNQIAQSATTIVTDPLGQKTTYTYASDNVGSSSGAAAFSMLETQRSASSAAGAALRTTTTRYAYGLPLPTAVQTVLADAPGPTSSEVDYGYDSYGNRTEQDDYDFAACTAPSPPTSPFANFGCGPAGLLRKTTNTFVADTGPWIVNKPSSETLSNGSGTT